MIPDRLVFKHASLANVEAILPRFTSTYEREGVALFPGLLAKDPLFLNLVNDLKKITRTLSAEVGIAPQLDDLADEVTALAAARRSAVGKLYDLGTRPNKLLSGMLLKLHPGFLSMTRAVFGKEESIIATPTLSDTLHVFPPGADSYRFNLPIHQDYPYLLQSPNQVTFWISLTKKQPEAGGMTVWCGSHKLGIRPQRRDANNHLECMIDDVDLTKYEEVRVDADFGDVAVFHSNILHRSEKNFSTDQTRIVQLFRFSDLTDPEAVRIGWDSADVSPKAKKFEDLYPDKILSAHS